VGGGATKKPDWDNVGKGRSPRGRGSRTSDEPIMLTGHTVVCMIADEPELREAIQTAAEAEHNVDQDMCLRCCARPGGGAGFIVAGCCPFSRWQRTSGRCVGQWRRGDIQAISANSAATPGGRTARNQAADREGQLAMRGDAPRIPHAPVGIVGTDGA
jgi:hypothetical protein